jgi:hypothetical protein
MKFKYIPVLALMLSFSALAQDNALRLGIGSLATGASLVNETFNYKDGEDEKNDFRYFIAAGYLRHIGMNIQLMANGSYTFDETLEGTTEKGKTNAQFELGALYNFSSEFKSSWYLGAFYHYALRSTKDVTNDGTTVTTVKSNANWHGLGVTVGKRFNLVENLAWVISVDVIPGLSFGGDYKDVYKTGNIARVNFSTLEYYF